MTKRQAKIYAAIKEAFEEADKFKGYFSDEEIKEIFEDMKELARKSELTTIKQLAMLYALYRLC